MINLILNRDGFEVWTDTEVSKRDGRCLALGVDRLAVLKDAAKELRNELKAVKKLIEDTSPTD